MKLSTVAKCQYFSALGGNEEKVEAVRQIALMTPSVICSMLASMGCIGEDCAWGDGGDRSIHVLVKEGTRELVCDGASDWKISFHFVFQTLITLAQFRCLYELIVQSISSSHSNAHLAYFLDLISIQEYEQRSPSCNRDGAFACGEEAKRCDDIKVSALDGMLCKNSGGTGMAREAALMGMDLHPRQNAYQGLACIGSKKKAGDIGNRLVGMMQVKEDSSWQWVPGYHARHTHPLLILTESSVIMPGPRCIGLTSMDAWHIVGAGDDDNLRGVKRVDDAERERSETGMSPPAPLDATLAEALGRVLCSEKAAMQRFLLRPGSSLSATENKTIRAIIGRKDAAASLNASSPDLKDVLQNASKWFRDSVAEMYGNRPGGYETAFRTGNVNMNYISKPCIIPKDAESRCSVVHVSRTEICMCTLNMLEVPFKVIYSHCVFEC